MNNHDRFIICFLYSYGLLREQSSDNALYWMNRPRNVASLNVQSFSPLSLKTWAGKVCLGVSNATCSDSQTNLLPSGQYRIRFSALKHFGNPMNPNDYEIYRSPKFNLIY